MGIYLDYSGDYSNPGSGQSSDTHMDASLDAAMDAGQGAQEPPARTSGEPRSAGISRPNLIQIIEGEIIPRLFLAYRDRTPHPLTGAPDEAGELADPVFLAELFLTGDTADIISRLQSLRHNGMARERIYLELLAPVSRTLSQFWTQGRCSFDEMAAGLCCIDDVLREMHEREHTAPARPS